MQKGTFYKPLCNLLISWWLQRRFFVIITRFAVNAPLLFVMLFLKNHSAVLSYGEEAYEWQTGEWNTAGSTAYQ